MPDSIFTESDPFSPISYTYRISCVVHSGKSRYQEILVLDSPDFGKMLVLDGVVQFTEWDEFFYHEMLAHVAMHAHPGPKNIMIIGGGDGGTLREVVKHRTVEKILLIEMDDQVIEVSKQFFPGLAVGFPDPRVNIICMDGSRYVEQTRDKFDIVIVDCTDPVGDAQHLFTDRFFTDVAKTLREDGILVSQTESLHFHRAFLADVQRRLDQVFKIVDLYYVPLATYAGNWWTFSIASKQYMPNRPTRKVEVNTRYYCKPVHRNAFLPRDIRKRLLNSTLEW